MTRQMSKDVVSAPASNKGFTLSMTSCSPHDGTTDGPTCHRPLMRSSVGRRLRSWTTGRMSASSARLALTAASTRAGSAP